MTLKMTLNDLEGMRSLSQNDPNNVLVKCMYQILIFEKLISYLEK